MMNMRQLKTQNKLNDLNLLLTDVKHAIAMIQDTESKVSSFMNQAKQIIQASTNQNRSASYRALDSLIVIGYTLDKLNRYFTANNTLLELNAIYNQNPSLARDCETLECIYANQAEWKRQYNAAFNDRQRDTVFFGVIPSRDMVFTAFNQIMTILYLGTTLSISAAYLIDALSPILQNMIKNIGNIEALKEKAILDILSTEENKGFINTILAKIDYPKIQQMTMNDLRAVKTALQTAQNNILLKIDRKQHPFNLFAKQNDNEMLNETKKIEANSLKL